MSHRAPKRQKKPYSKQEAERKKQTAKGLKAASRKQSLVNNQKDAEGGRGEAESKKERAASRP